MQESLRTTLLATSAQATSRVLGAIAGLSLFAVTFAQGVLFDNGPVITHPGAGFENADVSMVQSDLDLVGFGFGAVKSENFDNRLADDFEVTSPLGWQLQLAEVHTYQSGSGTESTIEQANFRIWNGVPGEEGSNVVYGDGASDSLLSSDFSGIYRTPAANFADTSRPLMLNTLDMSQVFLPPGTYWLDVQFSGSLGNGPWIPPVTILGEDTTGDALQYFSSSSSWSPAIDTGPSTAQGMPFVLRGNEVYLRLMGQDLAVSEVSSGDLDVPVLVFNASTFVVPSVELTTLEVQTVGPDGATPLAISPVAGVKLYLDADLDGVPDSPGDPLATAEANADGTATLDLSGVTIDAGTPVGFVVTYDLKGSQASVALPMTLASLAVLLPGLRFARRGRKALPLVALGLIVALVGACSAPQSGPDPAAIQFRALVTNSSAEVVGGPLAGHQAGVDASSLLGGTITVSY